MGRVVEGVLPVLHVSYRADGSIDEADLARELDWVYACGADGVTLAMVTDLFRLTAEERAWLVDKVAELNRGRGALVVSVGAESIPQAVGHARAAARAGADAVMAIPPTVSALSEDEARGYFGAIADAVDLPLVIQDASGYVGRPLSLGFQVALFEQRGADKILFKPETNPIGPFVSRLHEATDGRARVFEGSGGMFLVDTFRRGLAGVMPGCDLLDGIVALWRALRAGDDERAYELYFPIAAIVLLQNQAGLDGFMSLERFILKRRGVLSSAEMRRPAAFRPDTATLAEVDRLLARLDRAVAGRAR
jgi:4-hydroxy-tetrahydrodipicolinate synthase